MAKNSNDQSLMIRKFRFKIMEKGTVLSIGFIEKLFETNQNDLIRSTTLIILK